MSWTEEKVDKLKELWGNDKTASQIAQIIGGVSRNALIGKAHRLNLSSKVRTKYHNHQAKEIDKKQDLKNPFKGRKGKFKSLLLDKNYEPAKNLTLEELNEETCKYMEGHPDDKESRFCGRKNVDKFSYCPLHLMIVFQPKNKKDDLIDKDKDNEVPKFIQKKIKSA